MNGKIGDRITPGLWSLAAFLSLALAAPVEKTAAVEFIRGDVNGDREVTLADAVYGISYLFLGAGKPDCPETGDFDDSGQFDIEDAVKVFEFVVLGGSPPHSPYPDPGEDETPHADPRDQEFYHCNSYGNGTPLEDASAKIEILKAVAPGGDDARVFIKVALSHSKPIAAYSGRIHDEGNVISDYIASSLRTSQQDLTGIIDDLTSLSKNNGSLWIGARAEGGRLTFGYFMNVLAGRSLEPIRDRVVLSLTVCLKPGTRAGEYPLTLEYGELADFESGRAVKPELAGGTLRVLEDVTDTGCDVSVDPTQPPRPVLNALFRLGEASALPGTTATVPFIVRADRESQGIIFSIDFDEEVLSATAVWKLYQRPGGSPYELAIFERNNDNLRPGNAGVDEGFIVGAAIFSLTDDSSVLPPREEIEVLELEFLVKPTAPAGNTELRFLDGGQGSGGPVGNKLIAAGREITPEQADSFVFVNGAIKVVGDITIFLRGDANGDGAVDVSDAVTILEYQFLGTVRPRCFDAADANDDGAIDISDAVALLSYQFLGAAEPPPPFSAPGEDPTADGITCAQAP